MACRLHGAKPWWFTVNSTPGTKKNNSKMSSTKWRPYCRTLSITICKQRPGVIIRCLTSMKSNGYNLCDQYHYNNVIMSAMASQITSLTIVYPSVYSEDQRKHQSSASLAFARGIHRWPVNSPHKWPVTWKMFSCDDVIIKTSTTVHLSCHH